MNVAFYNFSKRRNSTKQPTGAGTVKNCKLKDNCSVHDPVILLANSPVLYDYAYISAWGRYYFVRDIISIANGLTEYHLTEDVLASNKTAISTTKALIQYASDHYNLMISDPRLPVQQTRTLQGAGDLNNPVFTEPSASYLLTVYNTLYESSSSFAVSYQVNQATLAFLRDWFSGTTVAEQLQQYFLGSPMDGILSVKWIPYDIPSANKTAVSNIVVGRNISTTLPSGCQAYLVKQFPYAGKTVQLTRPYIYNDFRAWEPYTSGFIYLPGVGNLQLSLGDWGTSKINVSISIECLTGNVVYLLFRDDGALIQSATCNVASEIPLGKTTTNLETTKTQLGGLLTFASGMLSAAASGSIKHGIETASETAINMNQHAMSISGAYGGRGVLLWPYITMTVSATDTEDPLDTDWIAEKGRPVGYVQTIGTFSGYVQCIDASVALNASEQEIREVNDFLNSGIYYE